ncbi:MAG: MltA domain-containing protein [Phycisphaerales bacterium]|nr:MAG: MltA domain-containing protein [Phycisphaerales bacterium]
MKIRISILIMLALVAVSSCQKQQKKAQIQMQYDRPLPPGQYALRKITDPGEIPDFTMACSDLANLRKAVAHSLSYLHKPSSRNFYPSGQITHSQALESVQAFADMLDSGLSAGQLNDEILINFDVYTSVGCDDRGTVLFTGYYTPIFEGSLQRTAQFNHPLYEQPDDLVKGPDGDILGRRESDGRISSYPDRAQIEDSGMLHGKELIYLGGPFEAYIAHVQGSAKVRLPDGNITTVGYAANNGHEYRSVAQELVHDGKIASDEISLAAMIAYFERFRNQVRMYVRRNPRFVFFKEEGGPPVGCLNEPVTPVRTIATDKSIFPRASLAFITTKLPRAVGGATVRQTYTGFALDQDAGGAIRAAGRCDVYMGEGETAGKLAGQTHKEGRLYYLFLKPDAIVVDEF